MNRTFKFIPLAVFVSAAWAAQAQEVAYSPSMLRALVPEGQAIDTSFIEKGFDIAAGFYQFTINVNGEHYRVGTYELKEFQNSLELALRAKDILDLPLKKEVIDEYFKHLESNEIVFPLANILHGVTTNIDTTKMVIDISIPQIYLEDKEGWVDVASEDLWDYGETGAVVNYNLSGTHLISRLDHSDNSTLYANLSARLNFGAWRLHSSGALSAYRMGGDDYKYQDHEWDLWNTYLQRDVPTLKGTLEIGEISTSSEIFDSIPLRGLRLATNVEMLPYKDRSYSPIIEGIANTNAQVIIRQNEHVVYTVNVAPGPFRLENLPSFGNYGDLEVVIKEADGTERILNVPYTFVPNMLRPGQYRYDVNVGRYYRKNSSSKIKEPTVFMGSLSYGLPSDLTLFTGSVLSEGYYALALGTGLSLGKYGAVAADVIYSKNEADNERYLREGSGAAWRIRYEKTLNTYGTTINLANYQYRTGHYMTMEDFVDYGTASSNFLVSHGRIKSRWQLSLGQNLGSNGNLSIGADYAKYHGTGADVKSLSAGYATSFKGVGVMLNYTRDYVKVGGSKGMRWDSSHTMMLNLNIPLSLFTRHKAHSVIDLTTVGYQGRMHKAINGETSYKQSVVMNGFSDDNHWAWSFAQELGGHEDRSTSATLTYSGDRLTANAGLDHSYAGNSYHLGLNGALVLHRTGVTATSVAYDSVVVVEVPGASGVRVAKSFDTKTDVFGNGILTYLSNYTKNEIQIDPATLPDGAILLDSSNRTVVPTAGSILRVNYPIRFGHQAVFVLHTKDGKPLPFGASVNLLADDGTEDPYVSGIVGEGGRVYLSALPQSGVLKVKGKTPYIFEYELPSIVPASDDDFHSIPSLNLKNINKE